MKNISKVQILLANETLIFLCEYKIDKTLQKLYLEEGIKITDDLNIGLMDTSTLGNTNVSEIFTFISTKIINKLKQDL